VSNLNIKSGIDTSSSTNSIIPSGALIMKGMSPAGLSNYSTDAQCIAAGYVPCDGRALNASTFTEYQKLFDVIGNIYGGTNNTNFTVPNLRVSRRYIYGQGTASAGIYTPSFSANTTNTITHNHGVSTVNTQTLNTNTQAGTHRHNVSYNFNSGNTTNHSHYMSHNMPAGTTGQGLGTTLTKSDGTGTAAGAAHTHTANAYNLAGNSGDNHAAHAHSGSSTDGNYSEPTHNHALVASTVTMSTSAALEISYINMLYFIKI
jgi:microcystin-dependent protein